MPAKSIKQQRFFGMVRAAQKGEMENPSSEVAQAAATMSKSDVKKFAKTKHKGLPMKKKVDEGFKTDLLKDRKYAKGVAKREKEYKERDARMKHGKNWKEFTRDVESAKKRLRPGEVKKWDPVQKKYVSNKD